MSITERRKKIKIFTSLILAVILTLVAASAYGLSILYDGSRGRTAPYILASAAFGTKLTNMEEKSEVVGSKNGKTYHLPWCSGAKRIKSSNLVTFKNREVAEKNGYRPALNCPDLKL